MSGKDDFEIISGVEWGAPKSDPGYDTDQSLAPLPRRERTQVCGCPPGSDCLDDSCVLFACLEECPKSCGCQNRRLSDQLFKKVEVIDAGPKGKGVRLLEDVRKGDILLEYVGRALSHKALFKYLRRYQRQRRLYILGLGDGVYLDARQRGGVARYINHSCEPNCVVQRWKVKGVLRAAVVASRDLPTGTELTFDYQWERHQGRAITKCHCGTPSCRGTLEVDPFGNIEEEEADLSWENPTSAADQNIVNRIIRINGRVAEVVGFENRQHQVLWRDNLAEAWVPLVNSTWQIQTEHQGDFIIAKKIKRYSDEVENVLAPQLVQGTQACRNYLFVQTPVKESFWAKHLVERVERSCQVLITARQVARPPLQPQSPEEYEMFAALDQSHDGTVWRIGITGTDVGRAHTILLKNSVIRTPSAPVPAVVTTVQTELICPRDVVEIVKGQLLKEKVVIPTARNKEWTRVIVRGHTEADVNHSQTVIWNLLKGQAAILAGSLQLLQLRSLGLNLGTQTAETFDPSESTFFRAFQATYDCQVRILSAADDSFAVFLGCSRLEDVPVRWNQILGRVRDIEQGVRFLHLGRDRVFQQLMQKTNNFFECCKNITGATMDSDPLIGEFLRIDTRDSAAIQLPDEMKPLSLVERAAVAEELVRLQVELYRDHFIRQQLGIFGRDWTQVNTTVQSTTGSTIGAFDWGSAATSASEIAGIVSFLDMHEVVGGHAATILYRFLCTVRHRNLKAREVVLACVYLANKCQKMVKTKKLENVLEAGYKTFYPGSTFDAKTEEAKSLADRVLIVEAEILDILELDVFMADPNWLYDTVSSLPKLNSEFTQNISKFVFSGQVLGAGPELWLKYGVEYVYAVAAAFLKAPLEKLLPLWSLNPLKVIQAAEVVATNAKFGKPTSAAIPSNPLLEGRGEHLSKYLPGIKEKCMKVMTERLASTSSSVSALDVGVPPRGISIAKNSHCYATMRGLSMSLLEEKIVPIIGRVSSSSTCSICIDPGSEDTLFDLCLRGTWRALAIADHLLREAVTEELPELEEAKTDPKASGLRQGKISPGMINTSAINVTGGWEGIVEQDRLTKNSATVGGKSCVCARVSSSAFLNGPLRWWMPSKSPRNGTGTLFDLFCVLTREAGIVERLSRVAIDFVGERSDAFPWLTEKLAKGGMLDSTNEMGNNEVAISIQRWPSEKAGRREESKKSKQMGFSVAALQELQLLSHLHRLVPSHTGHPNFVLPVCVALPGKGSDFPQKPTTAALTNDSHFPSSTVAEDKAKFMSKDNAARSQPHLVFEPTPFVMQRFLSRKIKPEDLHVGPALMASWFHDLVTAFAHCHAEHVVVRQLQPDQVLVDQNGTAKLSGLYRSTILNLEDRKKPPNPVRAARKAEKNKRKKKDEDDATTNVYVAPEILLGSPIYSKESDMWMLGCLLANILLGKQLFTGKERHTLLNAQFKVVGSVTSSNYSEATGFPHYSKPEKRYKRGVDKAFLHLLKNRKEDHSKAIDLISMMLMLDPKDRCSASDALKHPFFVDFSERLKEEEFKKRYVQEWVSLKGHVASAPRAAVTEDIERRREKLKRKLSVAIEDDLDDMYDVDDLLGISSGPTKKQMVL